jgi:hypothetical protein
MIRKGSRVKWKNNANSEESGKVSKTFRGRYHVNVTGIPVLLKGEPDNKILLIEKDNGLKKVVMEENIITSTKK